MTTAAAIDRLVHHAVILEMTGSSMRAEQAKSARKEMQTTTITPTTITPTTTTTEKEAE
jgi:hypothetical protein